MTMTETPAPPASGWWYTTIMDEVDAMLADQEIDWEELKMTDADIDNSNPLVMVKKLNRAAGYMVWVNTQLMKVDSTLSAVRDSMKFATDRRLALEENGQKPKPKGSQAQRVALWIDGDQRLGDAKKLQVELAAKKEALAHLYDALDLQWRTISRAISARANEPTDR